jgi:cytochrome c oxidase assembly protein subunit 15
MNLVSRVFGEAGLRVLAWVSVISEIIIVVTGGAVRLTGSGLGCPKWPTCTADSIVTVPAMGIHGVIEFANRLLTFVLLLGAALFFVAALRSRGSRKVMITSILLIVGIFLQAVVGGISVLTKLNPWIVGLHFVISALMIGISAIQLWRVYKPAVSASTKTERLVSSALAIFTSIAILIGIVVTGSGPHAGDAATPRNGLNSELWQHFHSYPAYVSIALAVVLLVLVRRRDVDGYSSRLVFWTTIGLLGQALLGVTQARLGLPIWMVLVHMALASTITALLTLQWLSFRSK